MKQIKTSKAALKRMEESKKRELEAFEKFETANGGYFNGFEFANLFHQCYNKKNAIFTHSSNDQGDVVTPFGKFATGADDITAYFFSEQPRKTVSFNRSIYFI